MVGLKPSSGELTEDPNLEEMYEIPAPSETPFQIIDLQVTLNQVNSHAFIRKSSQRTRRPICIPRMIVMSNPPSLSL